MRAIILRGFGGLDRLLYAELPKPLPKHGEVVIKVRGFGINHAETHMRRGEWAEAAEVSGIECVGIVELHAPGGEFPAGAKVAALMGGLGRTINGSYAEYTRVRAANVALIESDLPWSQLAALPETYATAWTCLFRNLKLCAGQTIVIRGATSSFGQAAVKMAVAAGARVIAAATPPAASDSPGSGSSTRGSHRIGITDWFARQIEDAEPDRCRPRPRGQQHHPRFTGHAASRRNRVPRGLARRTGASRRLQSIAAHAQRRQLVVLR